MMWLGRMVGIAATAVWMVACAQGGDVRPDAGGTGFDGGGADADLEPEDGGPEADAEADADGGVEDADVVLDADIATDGDVATDAGDVDAGMPDAGMDAGPVDAGCTSAADCNDGLYCNGIERCEVGTCVAGTPVTCDDGVACTEDTCVEPAAGTTPSCNYTANDALCGAGETCNATSGCIAGCAETPCRLVSPQCGCPGGQGCYLSGVTRACSAAGSSPEGGACPTVTSCAPGLVCLDIARSGPARNQCNRFCDTDADCTGGALCAYTLNDGTGGDIPGVRVCTRACNPLSGAGCVAGAKCTIFRESMGAMRYYTDCTAPVGAGGQFAACTSDEQCQSGFACVANECLRWCTQLGVAPGGCSAGLRCYGFTTPIVVGAVQYGVCDL